MEHRGSLGGFPHWDFNLAAWRLDPWWFLYGELLVEVTKAWEPWDDWNMIIWWTNISLDLAGTFAALFFDVRKGVWIYLFRLQNISKTVKFSEMAVSVQHCWFWSLKWNCPNKNQLACNILQTIQYFYMLLADYRVISRYVHAVWICRDTSFQSETSDSHENIWEDSVQCDWWKEVPNHSHCSDTVCSIIQLLVLVIKFLGFCVYPIKTVTVKIHFILQLVFLRANLNDSLFIRKWLQGRSLLTMH